LTFCLSFFLSFPLSLSLSISLSLAWDAYHFFQMIFFFGSFDPGSNGFSLIGESLV